MNIFSRHSEKWEEHILAAGNANATDARRVAIDTLFTIWSERAERNLVARAGLSWQPRFRATGFVQPVVPKAATPQVTKALIELGVRLHFLEVKANKIYRRLNAVAKMQIYGLQLIETWANARRALWWFAARAQDFSVCFPEMLPSADEIKEIRTWLQSTVQSCIKKFHAAARKERSERLLGQERFKFVSKQVHPRQIFVNDSCDVQIADEQVRQYWGGGGSVAGSSSAVTAGVEGGLLEAFPQRTQFVLSPLEPRHLRAYLQKSGGAGGSCGWTHRELAADV